MSPDADPPHLYEVSASGRVFDTVRELAAVREFYRRLRVYPQFGDPLIDLRQEVGQVRVGIIPPLSMRYAVLEERRQVFVSALPVLMPKAPR